jgi:hypothetical protein
MCDLTSILEDIDSLPDREAGVSCDRGFLLMRCASVRFHARGTPSVIENLHPRHFSQLNKLKRLQEVTNADAPRDAIGRRVGAVLAATGDLFGSTVIGQSL